MLYPISNIMNMLRAVAILFASSLSVMAATDGTVAWSIHTSYRDNLDARDFGELATRRDSVSGRMETVAPGLPKAAIWSEGNREKNAWNFRVRAESDKLAKAGKGDLILRWQPPAAGSWKLTLNVRNDGLDVKGGDGGRVIVTKLSQNEYNDTASVFVLQIPSSKLQPPKDVSARKLSNYRQATASICAFRQKLMATATSSSACFPQHRPPVPDAKFRPLILPRPCRKCRPSKKPEPRRFVQVCSCSSERTLGVLAIRGGNRPPHSSAHSKLGSGDDDGQTGTVPSTRVLQRTGNPDDRAKHRQRLGTVLQSGGSLRN